MAQPTKVNKIAALGPAGTYGHQAAVIAQAVLAKRGIEVPEIWFQERNEDILVNTTIMGSLGCYGVAPIENARAGIVREVVDHWLVESKLGKRSGLYVIGEIHLPIRHCLLVNESISTLDNVLKVISHPQALMQCAERLNVLGFDSSRQVPAKSTAEAAQIIATGLGMRPNAAIASAFAAELYGLKIWEEILEKQPGNETRFHILGPTPVEPTGHDRTAIIFELPNIPSAINNVTAAIAEERVNMTSLMSIPLGSMNKYAFYIEIDCHMTTEVGRRIRDKINLHTITPIFLGSYPKEKREE